MSFHPFVSRWNLAMPRTIAGESVGAYSLTVTVWCTNAACTTPKRGAARGGTAAAPHAARGTIGGGLPGWTPPACAARPAARVAPAPATAARPTAAPATAAEPTPQVDPDGAPDTTSDSPTADRARAVARAALRRSAAATATKCTRSDPRGGRARRSCSSSEPPVQIGSDARSPVPVSGAWSPGAASGIHALHAPPRARTRTSTGPAPRTPITSKRRARSTRLVRPPSKSAGVTVSPKPRGRGESAANAEADRSGDTSDPSPAAAPSASARRRVILVEPTAPSMAAPSRRETAARSRAPCIGAGNPSPPPVLRRSAYALRKKRGRSGEAQAATGRERGGAARAGGGGRGRGAARPRVAPAPPHVPVPAVRAHVLDDRDEPAAL